MGRARVAGSAREVTVFDSYEARLSVVALSLWLGSVHSLQSSLDSYLRVLILWDMCFMGCLLRAVAIGVDLIHSEMPLLS